MANVIQPQSSALAESLKAVTSNLRGKTSKLHTFMGNALRQPSRTTTGLFALFTGVARVAAGDPTGVVPAVAGAREVMNLSENPAGNLDGALNDIHSDVDMVESLVQAHSERHQLIGDNLQVIKTEVETLVGQLDTIRALNTQGVEELQEKRKSAYALNKQAAEQYNKAWNLFLEAQIGSGHSKVIFEDCTRYFKDYFNLANKSEISAQKRVALLEKASEKAFTACQRGQAKLAAVDQKFKEAFAALQQANSLKEKAVLEMTQAVERSEGVLKAQKELAKHSENLQTIIQNTQQELRAAHEQIKQVLTLIDSLKEQLIKAKELARQKYDRGDVIVGIFAAAVTPVGLAGKMAAGFSAANAWHYRQEIQDAAAAVAGDAVQVEPLKQGQRYRFEFDKRSSGWTRYVSSRESRTVGTLYLNLGNANRPFALRVDLKDAQLAIQPEDALNLFKEMTDRIKNGTLSRKEGMEIYNLLHNIYLERGNDHPERVGLIKENSVLQGVEALFLQLCDERSVNA